MDKFFIAAVVIALLGAILSIECPEVDNPQEEMVGGYEPLIK